jgi:hypothetical protein
MLVIPEQRRIIINSSENAAVASAIPHAKQFVHGGESMLAMPYGVDDTGKDYDEILK